MIVRIFIVNEGKKQTFAFDLDAFVSYNVDTRELTLMNGRVCVHADSEDDLIRAYRTLDDDEDVDMSGYYEEFDRLKAENEALRREIADNDKHGFFKRWRK